MNFGLHLLRRGVISADDFVEAVEWQCRHQPMLGAIAIESRKLSMHQVFTILEKQAESTKPFGRIAVELGYITERDLMEMLGLQCEYRMPLAKIFVETHILTDAVVMRELQNYHVGMMSAESVNEETSAEEEKGTPTGHIEIGELATTKKRTTKLRTTNTNRARRKPAKSTKQRSQ